MTAQNGFIVKLRNIDTGARILSFDAILTRVNLYSLRNDDMVYAISDDLKHISQVFYYKTGGRVTLDSEYTPTQILDENTIMIQRDARICHVYGLLFNPTLGDITVFQPQFREFGPLTPVYVPNGGDVITDIQFHLEMIPIEDVKPGDFVINGESDMSPVARIEYNTDDNYIIFHTEDGLSIDFEDDVTQVSIIRLDYVIGG